MKLTKGLLVRRKLKSGKPTGPYMQITEAYSRYVYVRPIGMSMELLLHRGNVYVPKKVKLPVRPLKFYELKNRMTDTVVHKSTATYQKMLKDKPELIEFYDNMDSDKRLTVTLVDIQQELLACELHVRITIGQIIL